MPKSDKDTVYLSHDLDDADESTVSSDMVRRLTQEVIPFVTGIYRHLHQQPELSHQEHLTADFICSVLDDLDIPYRRNIGGEGILATLRCADPNHRVIALRADMDALPIEEETGLPFASENKGVMHACGHDAHVAALMGVLNVLNSLKKSLKGTLLFVFQPSEEQDPSGAMLMLKDGLFDQRKPDFILAQHSSIDHQVGDIALSEGMVMASADEIHVTFHGHGGHGALPHLINDTVLCAAQTLVALQQVVARMRPPFTPSVLSFGRLIADGATNIIPSTVTLDGSFRTMDENWRREGLTRIREIIAETAKAHGCTADINISKHGYPTVLNDPELTRETKDAIVNYLGTDHLVDMPKKMTAEDFGFFSQEYKTCFYRFGVRGTHNPHSGDQHTPTFQIDEDCFPTAIGALAYTAATLLNKPQ